MRGGFGGLKRLAALALWVFFIEALSLWIFPGNAYGAMGVLFGRSGVSIKILPDNPPTDSSPLPEGWEMGLEDFDLEKIQNCMDSRQDTAGLSFEKLVNDLMAGRLSEVMRTLGRSLKDSLFGQISGNAGLLAQVVALGIIGAVFTNFSSIFSSSQVAETGYFATYLLLFSCLAASFASSIQIAAQVVMGILEFMRVLMPAFFMAAAFAGGSLSAAAVCEFTLWLISTVQWLMVDGLLPLARVYLLLVLAGHVTKEDVLSKLTELVGQVVEWSLKTLIGLVLGFHLLQGMVLPYVDSMKSTAVQRLIGVIPGVGAGAGAITQMVVGSGVIIKNSMGAAGMVVLLVMAAVPVLKLTILAFLYQGAAALLQPVCDKRIVSCISKAAGGQKMLLNIVLSSALLFVITIAVVCSWKSFSVG